MAPITMTYSADARKKTRRPDNVTAFACSAQIDAYPSRLSEWDDNTMVNQPETLPASGGFSPSDNLTDGPWDHSTARREEELLFERRHLKISIVVPARNEAESIGAVLCHCRRYADELLVVDGHSTDQTRAIAAQHNARVVLDNGKGKGDAIRVAIAAVTGDIIVFVDADQSHRPADIPRLLAPILRGQADHVVGSRSKGGSDELHGDIGKFIRMVGSDVITLGINYRFGASLTDSQNGFRALLTAVARSLGLKEDITTIEQEMTIKTLARGYRMAEVPTHEYPRRFGESKIAVSRVAVRYVYSWLKYLLLP